MEYLRDVAVEDFPDVKSGYTISLVSRQSSPASHCVQVFATATELYQHLASLHFLFGQWLTLCLVPCDLCLVPCAL